MKPKKAWTEMTTAELREATRDLNGTVLDQTRPLNAAERALWRKARKDAPAHAPSHPIREQINITLERKLLRKADRVAKQEGLDRSELIARALLAAIKKKAG